MAERWLSVHEAHPAHERVRFLVGSGADDRRCGPSVCGDQTSYRAISTGLGHYCLSEYCHTDGEDGPQEAGIAAAAVILAAEHYMYGCTDIGVWAGERGI